jgi:putative ABC transport system permease protein
MGTMMRFGKLEGYAYAVGIGVDDLAVLGYELQSGTTQLAKGTVIIGSWIPQNFYDPQYRPGQEAPEPPQLQDQTIRMVLTKWSADGVEIKKTIMLKVVGVLAETRGSADSMMFVSMDDSTAWNEWANGKRINRNKDGYSTLIVKAESAKVVLDIAQSINDMGYMASTPQEYVQGINSFFTILQVIFGGVGAIALLVAAIGIANTMAMAILERTREIGLMKAVGATNKDILSIFLGEAAGIGFLGGLGGVLLGWGGSKIINVVALSYLSSQASDGGGSMMTAATITPVWLLIFALLFSSLVGLISGLFPALRAATMVPVTALKYE